MLKIIINGGDALPQSDCPKSWEEAEILQTHFNRGKEKDQDLLPYWDFDCGFKLDFDGSLITVSSRFYPPKEGYGPGWDGNLTIYIMGIEKKKKRFQCSNLRELYTEVNAFMETIVDKLKVIEF